MVYNSLAVADLPAKLLTQHLWQVRSWQSHVPLTTRPSIAALSLSLWAGFLGRFSLTSSMHKSVTGHGSIVELRYVGLYRFFAPRVVISSTVKGTLRLHEFFVAEPLRRAGIDPVPPAVGDGARGRGVLRTLTGCTAASESCAWRIARRDLILQHTLALKMLACPWVRSAPHVGFGVVVRVHYSTFCSECTQLRISSSTPLSSPKILLALEEPFSRPLQGLCTENGPEPCRTRGFSRCRPGRLGSGGGCFLNTLPWKPWDTANVKHKR